MQISIKLETIKSIKEQSTILNRTIGWDAERKIEKNSFEENESAFINLGDLSKEECKKLHLMLSELKFSGKSMNTLLNWIKNLENPNDAVITSLPQLEKTLISIIKPLSNKWLLRVNADGMNVACGVTGLKYKNRSNDNDAHVVLKLSYIFMKSNSSYGVESREIIKEKIDTFIYFYKDDISPLSEDEFNNISSSSNDDDDNDDDNPKSRKKSPAKKTTKSSNFLLSKILADKNLMLMNDDFKLAYENSLDKANNISKKIGKMHTCLSKGYVVSDTRNGLTSWKDLNTDNIVSKLVVDDLNIKEISYTVQSDNIGTVDIPIHPYILTYDITSFRYAIVHADNIVEYKYSPNIIDKLVLPDKTKRILSSLIGSKNNFEDIISGKSGGIVILSTGESGLGKTLTAEVYSEIMQKPLYSVQSSQLGISVSDIEINLNKILHRAEKWDAVLLIDEADSYIYKRGNDILQNCIVGTFLRLLEYYNGILFLTSNRPDTIDDAIISRVTLHIKYKFPTQEESIKLWNILCENFKLKISQETINAILTKYESFSGRDIRNTLKDISKVFPTNKIVEIAMIEELAEFLPFIKLKS